MVEIIYKLLQFLFSILPKSKNKVIFFDYYGSKYGCNPKYISQELYQNKTVDIIWAFTNPSIHNVPKGIRRVKYGSISFFYELCTSKVIITNYRMPLWFKKSHGQKYIQTWHSSMRLKMIERDVEENLPQNYIKMAKRDSSQIDLLLSGSRHSYDTFKRALWYDGKILESGTPRCDLLIQQPEILKNKCKEKLSIPKDHKVLLYAPTFRTGYSLDPYNINFGRIIKESSDKWIILIRLHPHMQHLSSVFINKYPAIIDVSSYDDLQELLLVTDLLISDYSGLIFDFALTRRPCILYTPDINEYIKDDRNLYFDPLNLPFPLCRSNDALINIINNFPHDEYLIALDKFMNKLGTYEDGNSSKKICKYITTNYLKI